VRHLSRDSLLVVKACGLRGVSRSAGQEFQRDRLIEREIIGAVDLAHPASPEQRDEPISTGDNGARREPFAGERGRRRRQRWRGRDSEIGIGSGRGGASAHSHEF